MAAQNDSEGTTPLALSLRIGATGEGIVELRGELDIASAEVAVRYVRDVINRHHGPVIADLTALAFCDAQGLAVLGLTWQRVRLADWRVIALAVAWRSRSVSG